MIYKTPCSPEPNFVDVINAYLVRKDESYVVVVDFCVDEKRSLKVDASEAGESDSQTRVRVHGLHNLGSLVVDHPVGVDLGVTVRVQHHRLVGPEVWVARQVWLLKSKSYSVDLFSKSIKV